MGLRAATPRPWAGACGAVAEGGGSHGEVGGGLEAGAEHPRSSEGRQGGERPVNTGAAERALLLVLSWQCHRELPWAQVSATLRPGWGPELRNPCAPGPPPEPGREARRQSRCLCPHTHGQHRARGPASQGARPRPGPLSPELCCWAETAWGGLQRGGPERSRLPWAPGTQGGCPGTMRTSLLPSAHSSLSRPRGPRPPAALTRLPLVFQLLGPPALDLKIQELPVGAREQTGITRLGAGGGAVCPWPEHREP